MWLPSEFSLVVLNPWPVECDAASGWEVSQLSWILRHSFSSLELFVFDVVGIGSKNQKEVQECSYYYFVFVQLKSKIFLNTKSQFKRNSNNLEKDIQTGEGSIKQTIQLIAKIKKWK